MESFCLVNKRTLYTLINKWKGIVNGHILIGGMRGNSERDLFISEREISFGESYPLKHPWLIKQIPIAVFLSLCTYNLFNSR